MVRLYGFACATRRFRRRNVSPGVQPLQRWELMRRRAELATQTAVPNNPENDGLMQVSGGVGQGEFGTDLSGFLQRIDKNRLIRNQLIPRSSRAAEPRNQAPGQQNS